MNVDIMEMEDVHADEHTDVDDTKTEDVSVDERKGVVKTSRG
jgi:hypothetical protein